VRYLTHWPLPEGQDVVGYLPTDGLSSTFLGQLSDSKTDILRRPRYRDYCHAESCITTGQGSSVLTRKGCSYRDGLVAAKWSITSVTPSYSFCHFVAKS